MRAIELFSLAWSQTLKARARLFLIPVLSLLLLPGLHTIAQPVVTVRFANPEFVCTTQTYSVDVEFQCNTSSKQLFGINIRFFYPDDILEFSSFGEFQAGYSTFGTTTVSPGNASSGMTLFGFPGPSEFVNGAVQKNATTPVTYISTTEWTKLFNINFDVDDPDALSSESFCPSIIWDMKEDPASGSISGFGVIITLVVTYPNVTIPAIVNVNQFNWQYDGIPGDPHGYPVNTSCIDPNCVCAPDTYLPVLGYYSPGPFTVPVIVTHFEAVGAFSLVFEYDPAVMTFVNFIPNNIFTLENGLLTLTDSESTGGKNKITMNYDGNTISLADNAHLADLQFIYNSGSADLTWKTDGTSCKYFDANNNPLYDQPYTSYYYDGEVIALLAPITKIDSVVAIENDYVTYAVRVWDFNNIQSGFLTLNFDPVVLVFYNALPNPLLTATYVTDLPSPGTLEMSWSGTDASLSDESILVYLTFQYLGSSSPLTWFNEGISCQFINSKLFLPLADEPTEDYYLNGNITAADFVWTGETSNDWNTCTNWIDNVIPDKYKNVVLDPAVTRTGWPTFTGNFTLGDQCKNLTLAENAQFTVTGDFTIKPGCILDMNGSGILQVGGNWTNSGIFYPGEGTIEFIGTEDGTIAEGVPPGNYVTGYVLTHFNKGMIAISMGTTIPVGDNVHRDVNIGFTFNYLGLDYTQVRINSNGWLSLNLTGDDAISSINSALFNTSAPFTVLAPWWDDLIADASSTISRKTVGTAPNRVFTVEWKNILAYSAGATARLNFQVKLYETSNIIEFHYGNVTNGTHSSEESASIGIKDSSGGIDGFIEATTNTTNTVVSFLRSPTNWPTVNYRLSPPAVTDIESYYHVIVSKTVGKLNIARDVAVTGTD